MSIEEGTLALIQSHLGQVRVPTLNNRVYKDECVLSFDTPESPNGLYVNLNTFQAFGRDHVEIDHKGTGNALYLHQKWTKKAPEPDKEEAPKVELSEDGSSLKFNFDASKVEFDKHYSLVVLPSFTEVPYPNDNLPELITHSFEAIISHDDTGKEEAVAQYEDEEKIVSKYAESLIQLDNGIKISPNPKDWACAESGMRENLWLNLSTGHIGSGRRNWDGTGGTGAALRHFQETGQLYPLVVKLGTITPHGADVYSYSPDENRMVIDPLLAQHLVHWGINMMDMRKTDKTLAEMTLDLNLRDEWKTLTEEGKELKTMKGPGYVGLNNLGNSCYCNSLYQVLLTVPEFQQRYFQEGSRMLTNPPSDAPSNIILQFAKLAHGLLSDRYAEQGSIAPGMVKRLLGRDHQDFSTNLQQDVHEYYLHVLTALSRAEKAAGTTDLDVTRVFRFMTETRLQCDASLQVSYQQLEDNALSLGIPLDAATNVEEFAAYTARQEERKKNPELKGKDNEEQPVLLKVPFAALLERFCAPEKIDDFLSPVTQQRGTATKTTRLATFPKYMLIHLRKYILGPDWTPKKLDVQIPFPEDLNIEFMRGMGLQSGEKELPSGTAAPEPQPDAGIVASIVDMGFSENAGKRAALATKNSGLEPAMNWVMEHMGDADINDPLPSSSKTGPSKASVDPDSLAMLMAMGINEKHATKGLQETGGDLERAAEWCFSHPEDMDTESGAAPKAPAMDDGPGKYRLMAFISHMGINTFSGHYVCHIRKEGQWVIYNDNRVYVSENPPFDRGYLYLYQRID